MLSRFGWKWTVLAYMAGRVLQNGKELPSGFVQDLRTTRVMMESGGQSLCDMAADLRELEIKLFPILLSVSEGEVHTMLELLGKAMNGSLEERDMDLSHVRPVLPDASIPKICFR
jgi:hypothetical protein